MILCLDEKIVVPWVYAKTGGAFTDTSTRGIGKMDNKGQLQAGVAYELCNGVNIYCHIAGLGNWACREFLAVIFDYPFNQIGVRRITVPVCSTNTASKKLVQKMGFKLESTLSQATPGGDMLIYRMFKDECKYLRGRYAKRLKLG